MSESESGPVRSIYVHVPFCAQKCNYCAFYSHPPEGELAWRYVRAMLDDVAAELGRVELARPPDTIFFGGGTPSLLTLKQWETILERFEQLGLRGAAEWSIECNPATVSADKARLLRSGGVNRVSMGVQSLNAGLLDRLGRVHSREMVFRSYDVLRSAGFENINLDLMFGIPGQTLGVWDETLKEALAMGSEHLSCYEVIYEEDTPLFEMLQAGQVVEDEELACAMYEQLIERVEAAGFTQYEVANFAKGGTGSPVEIPSRACRHNVNYWRGGQFLAVGPSATGYLRGVRTKRYANTTVYCQRMEAGESPVDWSESLPPLGRAGEMAAFGLRMNAGWPLELFRQRAGFDFLREWDGEIRDLIARGHGVLGDGHFRLTREGLRHADAAAEQFLRPGAGMPELAPRVGDADRFVVG